MLQLDHEDLSINFDDRFLERGERYWEQGRVDNLKIQGAGRRVTANVRGSRGSIYNVKVEFELDEDDAFTMISGYCSCPVGFNCKHVAAVLLEALEQQEFEDDQDDGVSLVADEISGLDAWFKEVESVLLPSTPEAFPPHVLQRLLYVVTPREVGRTSILHVELQLVRHLKPGEYGRPSLFRLDSAMSFDFNTPDYLLPQDRSLLNNLRARTPRPNATTHPLEGHGSAELFLAMVDTGRCHWRNRDNAPLRRGESRRGTLAWQTSDNGRQHPVIQLSPPASEVLPVVPLLYLDLATAECGSVEMDLPYALVQRVLQAPAIGPKNVERVRERLMKLSDALPLPQAVEVRELEAVQPSPVLQLAPVTVKVEIPEWFLSEKLEAAGAFLRFDYNGKMVSPTDGKQSIDHYRDGFLNRLPRCKDVEIAAMLRLMKIGLMPLTDSFVIDNPPCPGSGYLFDREEQDEQSQWINFLFHEVPVLRAEGWRVDLDEEFPYRFAEADEWYVDIDDQSENHWFDLELGVSVAGDTINLLPLLIRLVQHMPENFSARRLAELPAEHKMIIPLDDGRLLPVPTGRIKDILHVLVELYDRESLDKSGRMRLSELRAMDLGRLEAALGATEVRWFGGERLRQIGERLRNFEGIQPVDTPAAFTATLRSYQKEGLNWLQFLREYEFGGVLADDMGLGKTVQSLAHLVKEKEAGRMDLPSIVVAPTSLMLNWRREAARFAPNLQVLTLHGPDRKQHFDALAHYDLILTTYPLLVRDETPLLAQEYHLLILDEAQYIKNAKAKSTLVAQQLRARHRLCLSGTPMENHLGELWSVFNFLMPGLLGDERRFRRLFRTPIEKQGDDARQYQLGQRIAPFLLRRTKDVVATELPPKTEMVRVASLSGAQRDIYETVRLAMHEKVRKVINAKGMNRSHIEILDALLKLRQICCDPRLVKMDAARKVKQSAKLEMLMGMLPELIEEGRRILLFSQFTSMLKLIEEELTKLKIQYVKLTGQTRKRETPIQRFEDGEVPLFLISLKAGGTGLNLTAADTVIHYDPWWNPAVESQATDRAHRIGQDKPVFVYKLLTEGTVEERIAEMQVRKRALAEGLFNGKGAGGGQLKREDLESLFAPL